MEFFEKSVVSVNSEGLLTEKKTGTATITAKINGKKYTYKITVVKRTEKNVLNIAWSNYVTKAMFLALATLQREHWKKV